MKRVSLYIMFFILFNFSIVLAILPQPVRIGGTVTVDGQILTQADGNTYEFTVTDQYNNAYSPTPATTGLNASDWYILDIPIYDSTDQTGGANSGDTAIIHLFHNGKEYRVTSPAYGEMTVGDSGSTTQLNIKAEKIVYPNGADILTTCTGKEIGIKINSGGELTLVKSVDPSSVGDASDMPENMIYGLIEIEVAVVNYGDTASVKVYLPRRVPQGYSIYKYNSTIGWYDYTEYVTFNTERDEITITFKDGGEGDGDNVENGIIHDPFGIGLPGFVPPACFINTLFGGY